MFLLCASVVKPSSNPPPTIFTDTDIASPLFPTIVTDVAGRAPSVHYSAEVFSGDVWTAVYVFETKAGISATAVLSRAL